MFKYKTNAEVAALTDAEREQYAIDKRTFESKTMNDAIDAAIAKALPPAPTEAEKTAATALAEKTKLEWKEMRESIAALKDAGTGGGANSSSIAKQLKENVEKLRQLAQHKGGNDEVVISINKALTNRGSVASNDQAYDLPDIGQLATRALSLYDLFPKLTIGESNNNGVIRYYDWDKDTIARAAAAVAEGATFPQSTAKFVKKTIDVEKVGDTLPITEEFFEDEAMFAAELGMFLEINVNLEIDRQLWEGDGTANQMVGLKASSPAYVPVAQGIADASIYDLIVVVKAAITKTGGKKYTPNFAVMCIDTINSMSLKKDANHNYVLPPFVSKDGMQVSTVTVIESNIVPVNQMLIGDSRFAKIYEKTGFTLTQGMINDQFTSDEMTLKARKRMAFLIRGADQGGFAYVSDIGAALVTIGS